MRASGVGRTTTIAAGGALGLAFLGLGVASVRVPRTDPPGMLATPVARGPDSYFHHVYDPGHLLGLVGDLDLRLDNFERETGHAIVVASLPAAPAADPDFTIHTAERWQVGARGSDDGLLLFVFTGERRLRVEVGYGLEAALPDARLRQMLEESVVPAFRAGDFHTGLDAGLARLIEAIRATPGSRPRFAGPGPLRWGGPICPGRDELEYGMASGRANEVLKRGVWWHRKGASKDESTHRRGQARA